MRLFRRRLSRIAPLWAKYPVITLTNTISLNWSHAAGEVMIPPKRHDAHRFAEVTHERVS